MAFSFGQEGLLKEIRIEIDKDFQVKGFLCLVSKGIVKLTGNLRYLNDEKTEQIIREKQKFPIIIHFKLKKITEENEEVRDYLKIFELQQDISGLEIAKRGNKVTIIVYGEPNGKWRASIENLKTVEILEEKNVKRV